MAPEARRAVTQGGAAGRVPPAGAALRRDRPRGRPGAPAAAGLAWPVRRTQPRGREPGLDSRVPGGRGEGGPGGRDGGERRVGTGAPTRRMPAQPGETQQARTRQAAGPRDGAREGREGSPPGRERAARGPGRRNPRRSPAPGRWGALQGGLGVCIIVASAAVGTIATMVTRSTPGFLLGLFVEAGTVAAALAVRPRAGRMIFPVPVLSYLVGALISGIVFDRSTGHPRRRWPSARRSGSPTASSRWPSPPCWPCDHRRPLVPLAPPQDARAERSRRPPPAAGTGPVTPVGAVAAAPRRGGTRPGLAGGPGGSPDRPNPGQAAPRARGLSRTEGHRTAGHQEAAERRAAAAPRAGPGAPGWSRGPARGGPLRRVRRVRPAAGPAVRNRALQLLQRGVAEHQVLDAVVGTEVDLRLGLVAVAVGRTPRCPGRTCRGSPCPRATARAPGGSPVTGSPAAAPSAPGRA